MKARSAAVQGVLAVVGLVAAYVTWQRPKESVKSDTVVIVDASKNALEKVRYDDGVRFVELQKKDRMYVTLAFMPGKRPAPEAPHLEDIMVDAGVDGGVVPAVKQVVEPLPDRTVFANERAENVWGKLTPFEATRALGKLGDGKLDELGLVGSERSLELTIAGQVRAFTISKPVKGLIGMYAQDKKTGEVFLIPSSLFNDLDPSTQALVERKLHTFKQGEFDGFTLTAGGKSATFVQTNGDAPAQAKLARVATPTVPDELAKNWHDKVWGRLVVTEVLQKDELPRAGAPVVAMRIDYTFKGQPKGWLELGVDPKKAMWARSENTIGWVALHQGSDELAIEASRIAQ